MGTDAGEAFGTLLRRFRVAAGMSREALAERSGLSADGIAALERGRRSRPRPVTLGLLADALGLGVGERALLASAVDVRSGRYAESGRPLPVPLTSFVGRERELAEVERYLGEARLLTLVGPGGTGKTRLALAVAERQPDASWFVALDACPDPALVIHAVATAVGAREVPGTPLAKTLVRHVDGLEGLLVLDNCEHVANAAAELVDDMLRASPHLRVLATSRAVLQVSGEVTWQVPPLPEADAVRLFTERAALAWPDFAVTPENADAVARVCRRLDGIPLAIELAAARIRMLTPAQIVERLDNAFALLTVGLRIAASRHRTLRAAVDWSYELLTADERTLFDRLSVFSGGFGLEAAEAVSDGPVLDLLATLVDQSLVLTDPDGSVMRYRVLEVLRQYGRARLVERGEEHETRRRHAEYYLRLVQLVVPDRSRRSDRTEWLPRLRRERGNLESALHWSAGRRDEIGKELALALTPFWSADGSINEGRVWLETVLASADGPQRIRALDAVAWFAYLQGDYDGAVARIEESVEIKRAQGDEPAMARRLTYLANYRMARGEIESARVLCEGSLEILRRHGDERGAAWSISVLGYVAVLSGELHVAEQLFREAMVVGMAARDDAQLELSLQGLWLLALEAGDVAGARAIASDALAMVTERLGGMQDQAGWLHVGFLLAEAEQRDRAALRLLGAIEEWSGRGSRIQGVFRARYQRVADQLRERTDPTLAAELMEEGAAMSPSELVAEILASVC